MLNLNKQIYQTKTLNKILQKSKSEYIKLWARSLTIPDSFVGSRFKVYNGKEFQPLFITLDMVGHKLGEFVPTRARYLFKKKKKKK